MKTVIIKIEKDNTLKQVLDFVKKLKLKVSVKDTDKESELEQDEWMSFSKQNLAKAYGDDEPEYDLSMLKEPNPEYKSAK